MSKQSVIEHRYTISFFNNDEGFITASVYVFGEIKEDESIHFSFSTGCKFQISLSEDESLKAEPVFNQCVLPAITHYRKEYAENKSIPHYFMQAFRYSLPALEDCKEMIEDRIKYYHATYGAL